MATKVVDLSEFRRTRRPGCPFAALELKPADVAKLKAAMQADDISARAIHEWMRSHDYHISQEAVAKHRSSRCTCA